MSETVIEEVAPTEAVAAKVAVVEITEPAEAVMTATATATAVAVAAAAAATH